MPNISPETLQAVQEALDEYIDVVNDTLLTNSTKETYIYHAVNFVRWLNDDFVPGETKRGGKGTGDCGDGSTEGPALDR